MLVCLQNVQFNFHRVQAYLDSVLKLHATLGAEKFDPDGRGEVGAWSGQGGSCDSMTHIPRVTK